MYCDLWPYVLWPLDFQIQKRILSAETIWGNTVFRIWFLVTGRWNETIIRPMFKYLWLSKYQLIAKPEIYIPLCLNLEKPEIYIPVCLNFKLSKFICIPTFLDQYFLRKSKKRFKEIAGYIWVKRRNIAERLKQTFPPIIWIFTEGEGIESRLSS